MIISDTAVNNRISVVVLAAIILVIGVYSYRVLPRESSPDITIPYVFVQTDYRGVSASDIETGITIKIENQLKGLDRIKNVSSVSAEGLSQINIEFIAGTDIDEVLTKVKDKVDEVRNELPSDLENDPSVYEVNFSDMPIVIYALSGDTGPRELKKIADELEEEIEAVPGVLEVDVTGGLDREIRIEVDTNKLTYFQIPISMLQKSVVSENQNISGGAITLGDGRYQIKVPGEFETPGEILSLVVATHNGSPIYLKDVATVVDGTGEETSRSRLNGRESVNISVKKRVGENIITISEKIDDIVKEAGKTFPKNVRITKLVNEAKQIKLMVADLENNIISGLILVVAVLLVVLGIRNALLVGLAIPFSMFLSFAVLHALGITLNMVVLFSLTLALGMLVDNAIVIDMNEIRKRVKNIAGVKITVDQREEGPPTGPPVNIEISGNDFKQLGRIAEKVKGLMEKVPNVKDVRDDYIAGLPSIQIDVDRQKTAFFGLTTSTIGNALKTAYNGLDISTYYEGDDEYDIVVKLAEKDRKVTDILTTLMIPTPGGGMVPLTTLADIGYRGTLGDITRKNNERVVTVKANVDETKTTGTVARVQAEKLMAEIQFPPGYRYKFTGENEEQQESTQFLSRAFLVAIFLIFLILVTLFNSVAQPLIILTSVILSLGGVFWGLTVIQSPFCIIMTGVGVISLAGVVVNNAIVLIDYTNKLRAQGMNVTNAVVAAGATRLRPVLLTAVTTILGLLPMVTGISFDFHILSWSTTSQSSQWWKSMAIAVIFGLLIATVLTLVVVPTLYALIENSKLWMTVQLENIQSRFGPGERQHRGE